MASSFLVHLLLGAYLLIQFNQVSADTKSNVGYSSTWTINQELCAPDGIRRTSCVTVYANATTSLLDSFALRNSQPTVRASSKIRYINERIPGPTIEVQENEDIEVLLKNNQLQTGATVHWHGLLQKDTNFMDGVQGVTQCPVQPSGEFQYKFKAYPSGTFWYHSHMFGGQSSDGLQGPLIVRPAKGTDPHENMYDEELIMMISDWGHTYSSSEVTFLTAQYASENSEDTGSNLYANSVQPGVMANEGGYMPLSDTEYVSTLVNGKGRFRENPQAGETKIFTVKKDQRYRFRAICASGSWTYNVSAQEHTMTIIAIDGFDVEPYNVTSFIFAPGNRVDFIITADKPIGNYRLDVQTLNGYNGPAILHYEGATLPTFEQQTYGLNGTSDNWYDGGCDNSIGCPNEGELNLFLNPHQLKPASKTPVPEPKNEKNHEIYNMTFAGGPFLNNDESNPNFVKGYPYTWYIKVNDQPFTQFVLPKYPAALWKWDNVDPTWAVNSAGESTEFSSSSMKNKYGEDLNGNLTYGTNTLDVKLNSVVDIILNNPTRMAHPMHLHGYRFFLLGSGTDTPYFDEENHGDQLNKEDPVQMDTYLVPGNGWAVLRFKADNPGWWAFHCHIDMHFATGMVTAFNVGEENQNRPPEYAGCNPFKSKAKKNKNNNDRNLRSNI